MYQARILTDSVSPEGIRLTTLEVTLPRIVLAEFNTHRVFSRNSASSRAIPVEKRIAAVEANPFIPESFGKNQKGMQAGDALSGTDDERARTAWLRACEEACRNAKTLAELNVHKQLANRLLEPFSWTTIIVTATEWANFFALRCNPKAQPEIRRAAELMREAMAASTPVLRARGEWHLPLIDDLDYEQQILAAPTDPLKVLERLMQLSVARCARVSYLTHDGKRDPQADFELYRRLASNGHMSPFEHAARPMTDTELRGPDTFCGNFRGWVQHRKELQDEAVFVERETTE